MNYKRSNKLIVLLLIVALTVTGILSGCDMSSGVSDKLIVNEVMVMNKSTIKDEDGEYSSWIEIYNNTNESIKLDGYYLSNDSSNAKKWKFPSVEIAPSKYMIVYASGKDKLEADQKSCHTSFKINNGETIIISDSNGNSVNKLKIDESKEDLSYGRVQDDSKEKDKFRLLASPTPGKSNSGKFEGNNTSDAAGTLYINEYMSVNDYICYDSDGEYNDWCEIYNPTDKAINLSGYGLSDDPAKLLKWTFPDITIQPKSYVLVWLSDKADKNTAAGELHASFKLGKDDRLLCLSDSKGIKIDTAEVYSLPGNVSYGRSINDINKWVYYTRPTPNAANNTQEFTELAAAASLKNKGYWISEVSSVSLPYNDKKVSDWIELYNSTSEPINLNGYGLSDDTLNKFLYKFGNVTLPANGYLIVYASGGEDLGFGRNALYAPFKLNASGETVYLTQPDGTVHDAFESGRLSDGFSSGRVGNEDATRYFFQKPTPGAANTEKGYTSYNPKPVLSSVGGYASSGDSLTITVPENTTVRYTVDGSEPTIESQQYSSPIQISKSMTVKAKTFSDSAMPSDTVVSTFIVGKSHTIPIINLSSAPDNFFGNTNGILANGPGYKDPFPYTGANFWKDWERPVHFEYFDEKGIKQVEFNAGVKVFGQYTRAYDQKSMSIHMRGDYGLDEVCYPFFKNNNMLMNSNFVIRAGGQDQKYARIRDAFASQVMKGNTTLAFMDWQPVAVYINGEYFGLYDLREKINESYFYNREGIDPDNIDIIKGNKQVLSGSIDEYMKLIDYIKGHNLSNQEYYDYVASQMDIDNYIDYLITEIYFNNGDTGNIKFYKEKVPGSKWKWVMFDFDMTLRSDAGNGSTNSIKLLFNPNGHGNNNAFWTTIQCGLLKNEGFKNKFIKRYAYLINNVFEPDRMNGILENMASQIEGELKNHEVRWGAPTYDKWKSEINGLSTIINKRPAVAKKQLQDYFKLTDAQMAELFPNG